MCTPVPGITLIALLAVVGLTTPAVAQSDRDLREENQRLQTEVSDLQRELEAAELLIAQLKLEILRLKNQTRGGPTTRPPAEEPVTIDETVPTASPRALLKAVQSSYQEATRDIEPGDTRTSSGRRVQAMYVRTVENWAKRVRREFKSPIEWTVRVIPLTHQTDRQGGLAVQAVDPVTGTELGDPFIVQLDRATRHKLNQLAQRAELDELVLRGVLQPQVTINLDRFDVGPFDNPRFIGPFAEFELTVEASSLTLPPENALPR